jgi:hypothetical protein
VAGAMGCNRCILVFHFFNHHSGSMWQELGRASFLTDLEILSGGGQWVFLLFAKVKYNSITPSLHHTLLETRLMCWVVASLEPHLVSWTVSWWNEVSKHGTVNTVPSMLY